MEERPTVIEIPDDHVMSPTWGEARELCSGFIGLDFHFYLPLRDWFKIGWTAIRPEHMHRYNCGDMIWFSVGPIDFEFGRLDWINARDLDNQ